MGGTYHGVLSTQAILGRIFLALSRQPEIARYLVTISPDVAMSTNLGGWIHKVGVYSRRQMRNYFGESDISLLIDWRENPTGKHIELGISENNLFLALGAFGLADELYGQSLLPIGTVYDPFVCRALDAFIYAAYSQAKFIVIGTPSGISLSPEGGAHQSLITPGIGVQLPGVTYYEPAYALELEWILLAALAELQDRDNGKSAYLRLSTKPLDQAVFNMVLEREGEEDLRQQVLQGGYRLLDWQSEEDYQPGLNVVHVFVTGAMLPEAVEAAQLLRQHGVFANVFNVTSADVLFHDYTATQQHNMQGRRQESWVESLVPADERSAPIVTLHDAPSAYPVIYWRGVGNADGLSRGDRVRTVRHPGRAVPALRDCTREYCCGRPLADWAERIADFSLPRPGSMFVLEWEESSQNFVIREMR